MFGTTTRNAIAVSMAEEYLKFALSDVAAESNRKTVFDQDNKNIHVPC